MAKTAKFVTSVGFTCQQADYVINNNLISTCNNGMKFCRLKVP